MNYLVEILISSVNTIFDLVLADGGVVFAMSAIAAAVVAGNISEGILANIRKWHGNIDEQFANIDNVVSIIQAHQPAWSISSDLLAELTSRRDQLQTLISKCRGTTGSTADRNLRSALLKSTVGFCLLQIRTWAYAQYIGGVLTAEDVHQLGFLLPGESGGYRGRAEATDVIAEVTVRIINEDNIRVVIDQSGGENAALVAHGWPHGVKQALIVITAADGKTEVYRQMTTRLHNDIRMPDGSHGKQFIIQASFLKHVNDEPRFGNQPTFSMPLTTKDLAATLDHQHHEDYEAHIREVERHRQEIASISG